MKYLLIYRFKAAIDPKKRLEFNRGLYGYTDYSNFGSYSYFRKGILDLKFCKKLTGGVVLLDKMPRGLTKYLNKYKMSYYIFKVVV